jgi:hypothetical protein
MRNRVLRIATLGVSMVGLLGCSAIAPSQPNLETAAVPSAELPARVDFRGAGPELDAHGAGFETQQRRGRRYRHRRIIIAGIPYFIPYFAYQNYYLPNYLRYDPQWYYVYAYTGPNFSGQRRLIRVRRDRDRDRDWNDRSNWYSPRGGDWRDRDRD